MAEITKVNTPSITTVLPASNDKISGLLAGEALTVGAACYIKSDGKVWLSTGAAANAAAKVDGYCMVGAAAGDAVTLVWNVNVQYGTGLTPGARVFLSGTVPGGLADAASTGGTAPIGFVVDATRIRLLQSRY